MSKTAIIAIGGNSLIRDKDHQSVEDQYMSAKETCTHIADLIKEDWNVVITHGNGPQVGFILLRSELAKKQIHSIPMDVAGADTQGAIGYSLQQNLYNCFNNHKMEKTVSTVITQVVVDKNDPGFQDPSKPVGPFYSEDEAKAHAEKEGWHIKEIPGRGWRRVVPSPRPIRIVELDAIKDLVSSGVITIAVGGGGIPVIEDENGVLTGTAAVIDKDLASSLLARLLKVDVFIISTDIDQAYLNFNTPDQKGIDKMTVLEAKQYLADGEFLAGSMGPKIQAGIEFIENGGTEVIITNPVNITKAINNKAGTHIIAE